MTKRITRLLAAIAALAALALGGAAVAGAFQGQSESQGATKEAAEPNDAGEGEGSDAGQEHGRQASGPEAERAKQAALAATGGEATSVQQEEPDGAEAGEPADSPEPGGDKQEGYQSPAGSAWEVKVSKGSEELEVYLDQDFKVLDTVPAEQE